MKATMVKMEKMRRKVGIMNDHGRLRDMYIQWDSSPAVIPARVQPIKSIRPS
jgi:hypothetical protein